MIPEWASVPRAPGGRGVPHQTGVLAPGDTSAAIINRLNSDINTVLNSAEVKERMAALGADPAGGSAEQFGQRLREEIALWRKVFAKPLGAAR